MNFWRKDVDSSKHDFVFFYNKDIDPFIARCSYFSLEDVLELKKLSREEPLDKILRLHQTGKLFLFVVSIWRPNLQLLQTLWLLKWYCEHSWQTKNPHFLQWCFRLKNVKSPTHNWHCFACKSGTQAFRGNG